MLAGILAILAALAPSVGEILTWWVSRETSPKAEILRQKDENREAIAKGTAGDLLLRRLDRLPPSPRA